MIKLTGYRWVPPFAQGVSRDMRVRWALEEAGLAYEDQPIGFEDRTAASHRSRQPFGQIPVFEEDGLVLFESGTIVLHIAERSTALLPSEPGARARTKTWMFAALNSVEPDIGNLADIDLFHAKEEWAKQHRPVVVDAARKRLKDLAAWIHGRDYLEDRFTAADLLMTTVLRFIRHTDLVAQIPALDAYRQRCEARPAFRKALADHMALITANAPPQTGTKQSA